MELVRLSAEYNKFRTLVEYARMATTLFTLVAVVSVASAALLKAPTVGPALILGWMTTTWFGLVAFVMLWGLIQLTREMLFDILRLPPSPQGWQEWAVIILTSIFGASANIGFSAIVGIIAFNAMSAI